MSTGETTVRNVVFIHTDQQRFDTLGCTGCPVAQTPNLDKLAAGGVNFLRHFVTSPVCSPSRGSMFTGKLLTEHGLWRNGCALPEDNVTLPQAMADAGLQTAHFGKLHLYPIIRRVAPHPPYGFDVCEVAEGDQQLLDDDYFRWLRMEHPGVFVEYLQETYREQHAQGFTSSIPEPCHLSTWVTDRAVDWLQNRRDPRRGFFLSVGYFDPHHAFNPCEPYASRFDGVEVPAPRFRDGAIDSKPAHYRSRFTEVRDHTGDRDAIERTTRAYHAMVAHVDFCVGRLVAALEKTGLWGQTAVVFTSDHGELLGNHGMLWKGPFMLDDLLRVPFIVGGMGGHGVSGAPGRRVEGLSSSIDLMPTMLKLVGAPIPDGCRGVALLDDAPGMGDGTRRDHVLAEWEHDVPAESDSLRCIRTPRWKLVRYNRAPEVGELYDLENDPDEFENRFADPSLRGVQSELCERLESEYDEISFRPATPYLGGW